MKTRGPSLFGDVTPLVQAAYIGDGDTFKLLVERGADLETAGMPPSDSACALSARPCVETMLKALKVAIAH